MHSANARVSDEPDAALLGERPIGGRPQKQERTLMLKTGRKHLKYLVSSFAAVVFAFNC